MKAIVVRAAGGPEVLRVEEVPTPEPGQGEALVEVYAAGVNFADTLRRRGAYGAAFGGPYIPGAEVAGVVVARGPGVNAPPEGERVMTLTPGGGYAQFVAVRADLLLPIPENLDEVEGAAIPLQGITAWHVLKMQGRLREGETVLIHAAAGGVGTFAVQMARVLGAGRIIATASSAAKLDLARTLGADYTIDYTKADFAERVLEITGGVGADVIADAVGGENVEQDLRCLAPYGRLALYGAAAAPPPLDPGALSRKNQTVVGYRLGAADFQGGVMGERPILMHRAATEMYGHLLTGRIRPVIGHELPLAQAAEAHRLLESRRSTGKIVLTV